MLKLLSATCVALMLNTLLGFGINLGAGYFGAMGIVLLGLLLRSNEFRLDVTMLPLYGACIASLVISEVPAFFQSWERLLGFILMTTLLSPCITSRTIAQFRVRAFWYLQWSMLVVTGVSAALFTFGFSGFDVAFYSGVTSHSMLMGPVAACSALFAIYLASADRHRSRPVRRVLLICAAVASAAIVVVSSSRAAGGGLLISIFAGALIFRKQLAKVLFYGLIAGLLAAAIMYQWSEVLTEGLSSKGSVTSIGKAESRVDLWSQRIAEFQSSPLFGIGFGAIDPIAGQESIDLPNGRVEPGSSWLAIASMLGTLGIVAALGVVARSILSLRRRTARGDGLIKGYLAVLLIFWAVHMLAEGYILAAGSFLFANVWLALGVVGAIDGYPELNFPPAS